MSSKRSLSVCVLRSATDPGPGGNTTFYDPLPVFDGICPEHRYGYAPVPKATASATVRDLTRCGYDVFLNGCDGAHEEDRAGLEVVQTLARYGQAYMGADEGFYEPTRAEMKLACQVAGVPTPRSFFARGEGDAEAILDTLTFPMIVKHPNGLGSVGVLRSSRASDRQSLCVELARVVGAYGAALVEEYLDGREFTALVSEPAPGEAAPRT